MRMQRYNCILPKIWWYHVVVNEDWARLFSYCFLFWKIAEMFLILHMDETRGSLDNRTPTVVSKAHQGKGLELQDGCENFMIA